MLNIIINIKIKGINKIRNKERKINKSKVEALPHGVGGKLIKEENG